MIFEKYTSNNMKNSRKIVSKSCLNPLTCSEAFIYTLQKLVFLFEM